MLRLVIFLLISTNYIASAESKSVGCRTSSEISLQTRLPINLAEEPVRKDDSYQYLTNQVNILKNLELNETSSCKADLENLQKESLQKVKELKNNKQFQSIIAELQSNRGNVKDPITAPELNSGFRDQFSDANLLEKNLYIFISFSMGKKALLNLAHEAKQYGAVLVLRGFIEGSYLKTAKALQKIITKTGQGVLIDPELFTLFNITSVPTYILSKPFPLYGQERIQTPIHDKLQGHVSARYALEQFSGKGDLKQEAHLLLKRKIIP